MLFCGIMFQSILQSYQDRTNTSWLSISTMGIKWATLWENQQSAYAKTKTQISTFVFATGIVQFLYFLNSKFQASSHLLCWVCVKPDLKPHCWFSNEMAQNCLADSWRIQPSASRDQTRHLLYMSLDARKPTKWFPNGSDTNWPVSSQKIARRLKFQI